MVETIPNGSNEPKASCASEKWNSFNGIEIYFAYRVKEIEANYDNYTEESQELLVQELKVLNEICNLKKRNLPLAKLIYLKAGIAIEKMDVLGLMAKRGKKISEYDFPVKYYMIALKCSRRTAVIYQQVFRALRDCDALFDLEYAMAARKYCEKKKKDKETVTQNVTIPAEAP